MKRAVLIVLTAAACAVAVPAVARNWTTLAWRPGHGGFFIDRDTIRRDGDLVRFEISAFILVNDRPTNQTPTERQTYDCRTKRLHYPEDGPNASRVLNREEAIPYDYVLCGIRPPA